MVHSATKYLGGHSDLTGGVVIGPEQHVAPLGSWRKNLGQVMAPEVAFLLARSLRTLVVRVTAQNATATAVAEFLADHPRVTRVNHPSLLTGDARRIVDLQMDGHGGMISFVYDGDAAATAAVVDQLELFAIGPSLGGVESLVTQPITTTHDDVAPEERAARGIVDGLVRLSCGLEHPDDLIDDLRRALG